jgi:hypothetical protein
LAIIESARSMPLRLTRLLLVLLLVSGQVGGWLHAIGHYAAGPAVVDVHGGSDVPDSDTDKAPCLLCLSYAALAVALLSGGMVFVLGGLSFGRPAAVRRSPTYSRSYARSARGPPVLS